MNHRFGKRKRRRMQGDKRPNSSDDAKDIPEEEKGGSKQPTPQAAGSRSPINQPKTRTKEAKTDQTDKHWLDYATGTFAFLAAVGGIGAAIFSGWQAYIANDNEHRYLRAYLHPNNRQRIG